jgi:hypothetical protein
VGQLSFLVQKARRFLLFLNEMSLHMMWQLSELKRSLPMKLQIATTAVSAM